MLSRLESIVTFFERNPSALRQGITKVTKIETHISIVLLTENFVYKFKKPVSFDFIQQQTLSERKRNCQKELLLNQRLSDGIYLTVKAVIETESGFALSGVDVRQPLDYCVVMRRLDDKCSLLELIKSNKVDRNMIDRLAKKLADFHDHAQKGSHIAKLHHTEKFQEDNIDFLAKNQVISEQLLKLLHVYFSTRVPRIQNRERKHCIVDGHGDLRLEHIYFQQDDITIIDCIEFNDSLRAVDPFEDLAFVSCGLSMEGRQDLADAFITSYLSYTVDAAIELLSVFELYRASVRIKVDTIQLQNKPAISRQHYLKARIKKYKVYLSNLVAIPAQQNKLSIAVVMGLPATGKSTVARKLAFINNSVIIATDVVRKKMITGTLKTSLSAEPYCDSYSKETTIRVYRKVLALSHVYLANNFSIVLDGTFSLKSQRSKVVALARKIAADITFHFCETSEDEIKKRLEHRKNDHGSISDLTDIKTWCQIRNNFEEPTAIEKSTGKWFLL